MDDKQIDDFFNTNPPQLPENAEKDPIAVIVEGFKNERSKWGVIVTDLAQRLSRAKGATIIEVQSDVVSERQRILERHHELLHDIAGIFKKKREKEAERTRFYMTQFDRKMTVGERDRMIEGDLAEMLFLFKIYTDHSAYLDETKKGLDHMIYGIRNVVSMIEYTNPMPK